MGRRILFVTMQGSIHVARWIDSIADQGWDVHLFPLNENFAHERLRNVTIHRPFISLSWYGIRKKVQRRRDGDTILGQTYDNERGTGIRTQAAFPVAIPHLAVRALNRFVTQRLGESPQRQALLYGPHMLARLIGRLKPDLIHSMEFQHMGYNVLKAKEIIGDPFPPWLATNWGSDIIHFCQDADHRRQITRLLGNIDYYSCECQRDVGLAQDMGFKGMVMPVFPNSGGFDLEQAKIYRSQKRPSQRRLIMLKGYQHFAGRALTALDALEQCADLLKDYEIAIYSSNPPAKERVRMINKAGKLNLLLLPDTPHEQMLEFFARARLYIGISAGDAISTSMLEAMVMGAFPIQTDTSCCDEWITDGEGGFIVPHDNADIIADRIRKALTDDALVDKAADINWQTAKDRLDQGMIKDKVLDFYDQIFADIKEKV